MENKMQEKFDELGALISKLRLDDDGMSIQIYTHMEGKVNTELELSVHELVDLALGIIMHKVLIFMLIYIQYMWMILLHLR